VQPLDFGALRLALAAGARLAAMGQVAPGLAALALILHRDLVPPAPAGAALFTVSLGLAVALDLQILLLLRLTAFWVGESALFGIAG